MRAKQHYPMRWRIELGRYVLHKLACAGLAYFTFMLFSNVIVPLSPEQWIYGCIMIVTILGDIIYSRFSSSSKMGLALLYTVLGFLTGFLLFINEVGNPWLRGVMGIGCIFIFYAGTIAIPRESLVTPLMAWLIPILGWILL